MAIQSFDHHQSFSADRPLAAVVLLLGLALVVAPFALGFSSTSAALNADVVLGLAILVLAAVHMIALAPAASGSLAWLCALLGALVFIAPRVLGCDGSSAAWAA